MGYASYQTGWRGEVSRREYRTLLGCEIVPAVYIDGKPAMWRRIVAVSSVTEATDEIVGLSYADAHATGTVAVADGVTVTLSAAATYSGAPNPVETYSRQIERVMDGDSGLWIVRITERCVSVEVTS